METFDPIIDPSPVPFFCAAVNPLLNTDITNFFALRAADSIGEIKDEKGLRLGSLSGLSFSLNRTDSLINSRIA